MAKFEEELNLNNIQEKRFQNVKGITEEITGKVPERAIQRTDGRIALKIIKKNIGTNPKTNLSMCL